MVVIETQAQIEHFAWDIKHNMPYIPENLRFLVIVEPEAFERLIKEILPPWAQTEQNDSDRFIYNSQAGIEFGIKKG